MRCARLLVVCVLAIGCAPGGSARRPAVPILRHTGSELIHESGLRAQNKSTPPPQQPPPTVTPDRPAEARAPPLAFSYDLYSDKQGHFTYDGAALALIKHPAHLQRVYADAARGEARPKQLVRELEYWFNQAGTAVADKVAALGCRVLPELQSDCRPPNWEFLEQFLGDTHEYVRLREVLAEAYARQARQLSIRNDVIVTGVNLLLAGSLAQTVLARAGVAEARTAARQALAQEARAASGAGFEAGAPTLHNLGRQLAAKEASGAFTATGELSPQAIQGAKQIIAPGELRNPGIPNNFGKYSTQTFRSPSGSFQVHFYMNPTTGEVFYGIDYKAVFNNGITTYTPGGP